MDDERANLSGKAPCLREDALEVLRRLREAGHESYFAGGCVRDLLMGHAPKDYDIATDAPPARVRELFRQTQAVGQAFGVILVRRGASTIEVATFRAEGVYSDGRRPDSVRFTSAEHDAQRRDFTINGLFLDPLETPPPGRVIDYVGGREDLRRRVLRAIGQADRRFAEDHLRLLRAVRFAARFELEIEPLTAAAVKAHAPRLKGISPERIGDELRMMLAPITRVRAWRLLWELELTPVIFRLLPSTGFGPAEPETFIFPRLAPGRPISLPLALAAAVIDHRRGGSGELLPLVSRQEIARAGRALRDALKISNDELGALEGILQPLSLLLGNDAPALAQKKRFLARATSAQTRLLLRAIADGGEFAARIAALEREFAQLERTDVAPVPLLSGGDLVAAGFAPGPAFKRVLDDVYDAQLEGRVCDAPQALGMARLLFSAGGQP